MRLKTKVNDYKATLISLHKDKKKTNPFKMGIPCCICIPIQFVF